MGTARRAFVLVYTLSGAAGLVYEVTWTRLLTLQLGHTVAAASTVLAAFSQSDLDMRNSPHVSESTPHGSGTNPFHARTVVRHGMLHVQVIEIDIQALFCAPALRPSFGGVPCAALLPVAISKSNSPSA